ncbi:hypothetical protein OBBRIDRAFT_829476 [Obba rivulosa]|uniref:Uncharacterized protein n=1 Tax=Obba rivulosa TaxID=1052685 RepID=A0A8E2APM8_9APHY|nr:hypothetical protein OBBRIDRAFT_829476 [Obba rivulosa]
MHRGTVVLYVYVKVSAGIVMLARWAERGIHFTRCCGFSVGATVSFCNQIQEVPNTRLQWSNVIFWGPRGDSICP